MRKTLLFAVVLLLVMALPTVCMAPGWEPKYAQRPVTFTGDIEGNAILEVYEHANKICIEWKPINLTYQVDITGTDGTNFTWLSENWLDYYGSEYPNYFGRLHVRIHKKNGRAIITYRFGRITDPESPYQGWFKFYLEGSRKWSDGEWSDGTLTVDGADGAFTIYELSHEQKPRAVWSGSLSFDIGIGPPI